MAIGINIASCQNPAALRQRLTDELNYLREQGLEVSIYEIERGQLTFLGCNIEQSQVAIPLEYAEELLRHFLANVLADIIITNFEGKLVRKLVEEKYHKFSVEEREKIIDLALRNSNHGLQISERHAKIVSKLVDYLDCYNTIILEGFIRFRLQDYQQELKEAISRAADDIEDEKEYQEFIQLLRYFISLQESAWSVIQVLPKVDGGFQLLDEKSQFLKFESLWDDIESYEDLTYGDMLISTLVCLSPATIILHMGSHAQILTKELVATIQDIFRGRVSFCLGCRVCQERYKL